MRKLLECLEANDHCCDKDTVESIKDLVRSHIQALEVVSDLAPKPPKLPENKES
jgi:hypothetical protein